MFAYGVYQFVLAITTYFRIPTISRNSTSSSVGAWFFWLNFLTWIPLVYAAQSNLTRIRSLSGESARYKVLIRKTKLSLSLVIIGASLILLLAVKNVELFISALPIIISFIISWNFGWVLGFVAGIHQVRKLYYSSALTSIAVFLLIIFLVPTLWWRHLPGSLQALILVGTSCITTLTPMIIPFLPSFRRRNPLPVKVIFLASREWFSETLATTPPAFFQGFSALAIVFTNKQTLLFTYGIANRIQLMVLIYSAAISIPLYNYLNNVSLSTYQAFLRTTVFCTLPIVPVEILLITFGDTLSTYLSAGKVTISSYNLIAAISVGLVLPSWLAAAAWMTRSDENRRILSRLMIRFVLPFSFVSSIIFTNFFGVTGNYVSVSLTYILATLKLNFEIQSQMKMIEND